MKRNVERCLIIFAALLSWRLVSTAILAADSPMAPAAAAAKEGQPSPPFPLHALLRGAVPPPAAGEPLRLVHVTDTHVVADGTILNGVDTAANLRVAIAAINALKPRPHLVAVTGDLTLDSPDGLWFFKGLMARLEVPYFPIPGNHDKAVKGKPFEAVLASLGFPPYYSFDYAGRHFVCVDAQEQEAGQNAVRGHLSAKQIAWLRQDLKEHSSMETLLFIHQHPLQDDWNAPNRFGENAPILRVIRENPQVRWIFNGHSHDNRFLELDGQRYLTTTATAYAFGKPPLPFAQHGSGFRLIELGPQGPDGSSALSSRLHALSGEVFPDPAPADYLSAAKDPQAWVKAFGPDTASYKTPPQGPQGPLPHVMVALCQVPCRDGALDENLRGVEEAAREAAARGAKIVCFPESMDFGWVNEAAHALAQPIPGPISDRAAALAKALGVYLSIGLTEKADGGTYDAAIIAGPDGAILAKHRKINNLDELSLITPAYLNGKKEDIRVVETPIGRLGLLICADTFIDEHLAILRDQKPDIVLVPYGWAAPPDQWPGHGEELKQTVCRAARMVGAPVIGPTCLGEITTGPWKGRTYSGESAAADADGNILFFGLTGRRQVAVFPVPLAKR